MPTRRVLKGVLANFLGTYTSRYSDYVGYWVFGFLVDDLGITEFDLLASSGSCETPEGAAQDLAVRRFAEQLAHTGLVPMNLRQARLRIERLPETVTGPVNGHRCNGYKVCFRATATADTGRNFKCEQTVFVAPHDPRVERRRSGFGD